MTVPAVAIREAARLRIEGMNLGPTELILVLLVVLVLFGGSKLPKLARSMGQAQKEFRSGLRQGVTDDTPDAS